jgi:hypothetical protein
MQHTVFVPLEKVSILVSTACPVLYLTWKKEKPGIFIYFVWKTEGKKARSKGNYVNFFKQLD